jgi:hypothetical protein
MLLLIAHVLLLTAHRSLLVAHKIASLETKVVLAGLIRQKGRSNTGVGRVSGGGDTDPKEGGRRHH